MKVKFLNKRLWHEFFKWISAVSGALSVLLTVVDFEQKTRYIFTAVCVALLAGIFAYMLYRANKMESSKLKINGTDVNIYYGNIFEQKGKKVIAFNEYFDTQVDDKIIAKKSLNGQLITDVFGSDEKIEKAIAENERLKNENLLLENVQRLYGGKTTQYKLGSVCPVDDYLLLAFTRFDKNNKAYLTVEDYITCLMHMWSELDTYYAQQPIYIPLLGGGITRFNGATVEPQDLLKYIIITFKASRITFKGGLNIVLYEGDKDKINLHDIHED